MRNPDQHDGSGARRRRAGRSTSTTPRVLTDAVCTRRVPPAASGSVPARGARLSGHPRPAAAAAGALAYGDGSASANVARRAETATGSSGPHRPAPPGSA